MANKEKVLVLLEKIMFSLTVLVFRNSLSMKINFLCTIKIKYFLIISLFFLFLDENFEVLLISIHQKSNLNLGSLWRLKLGTVTHQKKITN